MEKDGSIWNEEDGIDPKELEDYKIVRIPFGALPAKLYTVSSSNSSSANFLNLGENFCCTFILNPLYN